MFTEVFALTVIKVCFNDKKKKTFNCLLHMINTLAHRSKCFQNAAGWINKCSVMGNSCQVLQRFAEVKGGTAEKSENFR